MNDINTVTLLGRLTRDPELRAIPSGTSVCSLRLAVNDSVKDQSTGEWRDKPNFFDVDVFGGQGESCAQFLTKGRQIAVSGRLRWREWEAQDGGKRQAVSIVADKVQFVGKGEARSDDGLNAAREFVAGNDNDATDDDIPF